MTRIVARIILVGLMVLSAGVVPGQNYPNKPIRILAAEPGSGSDFTARLVAQGISSGLGQNVIVENRPSNLVGTLGAKASPDGYTLLYVGGTFLIGPLLQKMPYDPVRDFLPIALVASTPSVLVVHPSLPVKSVKELIALAKTRPGTLNYGSAASGSSTHLAGELFKAMAGVNIVRISYKGTGPVVNALAGGEVQLMFGSPAVVSPHIKSGRLTALAVTSARPSALFPGLPTIAASGLPGYESGSMQSMFAPAKTPVTLINRLNREIVQVLNRADVKERFLNIGVEATPSSPEHLAAKIKSEMVRMGKVIKDAGIREE